MRFMLYDYLKAEIDIKYQPWGPGWVAQLVRALSRYAKVVGLIPGQGTYRNQPVNA